MDVLNSPVYEGDIVFLYSDEADGYIYSDAPGCVRVFTSKISTPPKEPEEGANAAKAPEDDANDDEEPKDDDSAAKADPGFPNVHFAAFQILPSDLKPGDVCSPVMNASKGHDACNRSLVYGQTIKFLHMASRMLLSFGTKTIKKKMHTMAYLADWDKEEEHHCLLRVQPAQTGIKRQWGEDVVIGDAIRLKCITQTPSYYVLCTDNTETSKFEVMAAQTDSAFNVHKHISSHEKVPLGAIRGAAVVLIHNLDHEVYLSGHGSIADPFLATNHEKGESTGSSREGPKDAGSVQHEDVEQAQGAHDEVVARKARNIHSSRRITLCGDIFWQLEYISDPLNGDCVQLGNKVRIKHVPSQKYLAVVCKNDKPELTLMQRSSLLKSVDATFLMMQRKKLKKGGLTKTSCVEIRHGSGKQMRSLIIDTCQKFPRQRPIPKASDDTDYEVEQYDQVYGVSLVEPSDGQLSKRQLLFRIEQVQSKFVQEFYHVLRMTTLLVDCAQEFGTDKISDCTEPPEHFLEVVKTFGNWMREGSYGLVRAEMLRISKAVDVMMVLIEHLKVERTKKFLSCICTILKYFVNLGGKRCCFYLAKTKYINILIQKVGCDIEAEEVLSALARDEIKITDRIVAHLIVSPVMKEKLSKKDVPTLNLLSTLCFSGGRPVRHLQAKILQAISKEMLPQESVPVIKLFSRVCKGVNKKSIKKIVQEDKLVTFEQAFLCLEKKSQDPFLQSAYVDFLVSTLVDVNVKESGTTVDKMWHTFDWNNLGFDPEKVVADVYEGIPDVNEIKRFQDIIRSNLEDYTSCEAKQAIHVAGTHELIVQMLNAMETLVAYGFYWKSADVQSIIKMLISLIDGNSQKVIRNEDGAVKPNNENNKELYQIMTISVKILYLFFTQFSYMALCKMVYDYHFLKPLPPVGVHSDSTGQVRKQRVEGHEANYIIPNIVLKELTHHDCPMSSILTSESRKRLTSEARKRLRYYYTERGYKLFQDLQYTEKGFIQSLIDLIQFDDESLRVSSCRLLFAMFHGEKTLFSEAEHSYIYTEDLYKDQDRMLSLAVFSDLNPGAKKAEKLIWHMLQGYFESGVDKRKALKTLKEITALLITNGKDFLPNPVNQNLAYSTGLVNRLLEYVHYYCKEKNDDHTDLVTEACLVLQRSARRNAKVQQKLFEEYTDLLGAHTAPNAVAELLTEIFTDNVELCRKVSESELSLMFYVACTDDGQEELFTTLQAITKVSKSDPNLMIPRFQDILAGLFSESVQNSCYDLLHAVGCGSDHILAILKDKENPDNSTLAKILNICDLLTICSMGAKKFPEDVCQKFFSLTILIQILEDNDIPLERRKPFACLLTEVYLKTDRKSLKAVSELEKSDAFWRHAEFAAQLMAFMSDTIQSCFSPEPTNIKMLYYLAHHHLSLRTWRRLNKNISATLKVTCGGHKKDLLLSSVLLYLMEGFLPMITSFCKQLLDQDKHEADSRNRQSRTTLTREKALVLKGVGDGIVKVLKNEMVRKVLKYHVRLMNQCLSGLISLIPDIHGSSQDQLALSDRSEPSSLPRAVEINRSFWQFVKNYQQAYSRETYRPGGEQLIYSDPSFRSLIKFFYQDGSVEERLNKIKNLRNVSDLLYHQLQRPLTSRERNDLDAILFTILRLLTEIVYFTSTHRTIACESITERTNTRMSITQRVYKAVVKPLQEAVVAISPHGAHECIITHLAHPQNHVAVQAMAFLAALVYRGNEKTQQKIGQHLKHRDTELFIRMDAILELTSERIKASPLRTVGGYSAERESKIESKPLAHHKARNSVEMTNFQQDGDTVILIEPDRTTCCCSFCKKTKRQQQNDREERDVNEPEMAFDHETKLQVKVILNLVAWMCYGQRTENQELFREQETQFNSVNIVTRIAIFLQDLVVPLIMSDDSIEIAHKAIQALIELCTGNLTNQKTAVKAQILNTINNILDSKRKCCSETIKQGKKVLDLKAHALELLNILLQWTSKESCEMHQRISQDICIDTVFEALWALWNFQEKSDEMQKDAQKGMVIAFHILKRIRDSLNQEEKIDFDTHIKEKMSKLRKELNCSEDEARKSIGDWSRCIEVVYRSKDQEQLLTTVYFPFNPDEQMSKEEKEFIRWNIKRDSPEEKCRDLNKWMEKIYNKKLYEKYVRCSKLWGWTCFLSLTRYYVLSLLTLVLNLLTIIFFKVPTNGGGGSGENHTSSVSVVTSSDLKLPHGYYPTLYVLGSLHLILAIWMFIEYIVKNIKNFCFDLPYIRKILEKTGNFIMQICKSSITIKEPKSLVRKVCKLAAMIEEPEDLKYYQFYFIGFETVYRFLFVCFSTLSLGFSGYWYSGCLIYVFLKMDVLEQVRTALRKSALQLLTVFLLGLSIIFIYAVVSFAFFHANFSSQDDLYCETLALCFVTVARAGLLGTLSDAISLHSSDQDSPPALYPMLVVFDLTFLLIITILGFNILLSIMVDSFSQLRQEREAALKEDTQEVCFICGIKNVKFEHEDESFQEHITDHHNMWNYIYFYFHLQSMDPKDYSSIEKYVHDQIEKNDEHDSIKFYPLRKAKVLLRQDKGKYQVGAKDGNTSEPSGRSVGK